MPELPEVETIARTLAPQILGSAVTAFTLLHPRVLQSGASFLPRLNAGDQDALVISRLHRRAKLLLFDLAPAQLSSSSRDKRELLLAFHLKMTGSFFVHPAAAAPLKHTRLICDLADGRRLFFDDIRTFGYCRIMRPEQLADWPFWASLGPEPLDMPPQELADHFAVVFSKGKSSVKAALLKQEIIAGIGNIYADESLFQAGIHPAAAAADLDMERLLPLAKALQRTLRSAIRACGSSIRNYRDALGKAGAFQNTFAVYGRKGEHCPHCRTPLLYTRIAGRGTVYCPACQK
jgi:formamidopyrimidine-DNA glycosylase